jgi:hypothetical protein
MAIHFEQAVYGSFAFWDQGYAVLARSPGCHSEWLSEFRVACQRIGERPAGVVDAPGLFAMPLPSGPWVVVRVSPQGCDDQSRPGALAFHGLFISRRDYRRAGSNPFSFACALTEDWTAGTTSLPSGVLTVEPSRIQAAAACEARSDSRSAGIIAALTRGRRVAVEASGPIDSLARQVWSGLPDRVRARASVATWTFSAGNEFDLLGSPRLAGVSLDASYVDPSAYASEAAANDGRAGRYAIRPVWSRVRQLPRSFASAGVAATLAVGGMVFALRGCEGDELPRSSAVAVNSAARVAQPPVPVPVASSPSVDREDSRPDERRQVAEVLLTMADRFGVGAGDRSEAESDPVGLMERLANRLRYRGPFLGEAQRLELASNPGHDALLVLRWDAHAHRFAGDRPLPGDFRHRALRDQLLVLSWSFHSENDVASNPFMPRRSAVEVVQALSEALAVDAPVRPTPLAERYPAVTAYLRFLGQLPRR